MSAGPNGGDAENTDELTGFLQQQIVMPYLDAATNNRESAESALAPSPGVRALNILTAGDIFVRPSPLLNGIFFSHLLNISSSGNLELSKQFPFATGGQSTGGAVPRVVYNVDSIETAPLKPPADMIDPRSIAVEVVLEDFFTVTPVIVIRPPVIRSPPASAPPASPAVTITQQNLATVPKTSAMYKTFSDTLQLVFLICKRYAVKFIARRLGCPMNCLKTDFDKETSKVCHMHITRLSQRLQLRVPFDDNKELASHLSMCHSIIKAYCQEVAMEEGGPGQQPSDDECSTFYDDEYPIDPARTAAIFKLSSFPPVEDIIYYCMLPWLTLMFVSSFLEGRTPYRVIDYWTAIRVIFVSGGLVADTLRKLVLQSMSSAQHIQVVATYETLSTNIALLIGILCNVMIVLLSKQINTLENIQKNAQISKSALQTEANLGFRSGNLQSMTLEYQQNRQKAALVKKQFIALLVVVCSLVLGVVLLLIAKLQMFAVIASSLIVLAILIYALTRFLVTSLHFTSPNPFGF